jgi:hypothetical protein
VKLQEIYEHSMKGQIKRTKSVVKSINSKKFGLNVEHDLAVHKLQLALAENVKMAYPRNEIIQCVFCDASY